MSTRLSIVLSCLFSLFLGTAVASAADNIPNGENSGPVLMDGRQAPTVTYGQPAYQGGAYAAYGATSGDSGSYYQSLIPRDPRIPRAYPGYKPYVPYNRDTYTPQGK